MPRIQDVTAWSFSAMTWMKNSLNGIEETLQTPSLEFVMALL